MVERVDQGVGRILAALDRWGRAQNTIVIYTNDNGGEWLSRNAPSSITSETCGRWHPRAGDSSAGRRGFRRGKVTAQVGITMDLTASILAASGAQLPADLRLEGMTCFPILEGRAPEVERTLFWRAHPAAPQSRGAVGRLEARARAASNAVQSPDRHWGA